MKCLPVNNPGFQYLEQAFGQWLDILGHCKQTVYHAPLHIRGLFHYLESQGKIAVKDITIATVKQYYFQQVRTRTNQRTKEAALSSAHLNKHLQALNLFCTYLRQSGRLSLGSLDIKAEEKETDVAAVLTEEEIRQLYQAADNYPTTTDRKPHWLYPVMALRDKAMLTVYYSCGLRRTEGLSLETGDVLFERQIIHVRKGKNYKERFVPVSRSGLKHLEAYLYDARPYLLKRKKCDALFVSERGKPMGECMMNLRLRQLVARTGNPLLEKKQPGLHTLRHSIATHLLGNGMKLEKIKEFLGHSSLESTQIYTHLLEYEQN